MIFRNKKIIVYLGFNSFFKHKRGVENVVEFQAKANTNGLNIYIHWDNKSNIKKYKEFLCIGIKKNIFWPIILNFVLINLWLKYKNYILHSHNPLMSIVSLFKTDILTVHDALYYLTKANNYNFTSLFFILEKILYFRVTLVHFISNYTKEMSLIPYKKKYQIIHNTSFLEKNICCENTTKNTFQNNITKILIIRSIEIRARIDLVIEVAKSLQRNYEFTIVGKGPLLEYFQNIVESENLKNICFKGYVSDSELIKYYQNTNIVIVPAEFGEGFGLPIIEGYLFNKIVLASNKCAIPEIIFSKNHLFENNSLSIINKILSIQTYKSVNFKEYYFQKFSNKIILDKFERLYTSMY